MGCFDLDCYKDWFEEQCAPVYPQKTNFSTLGEVNFTPNLTNFVELGYPF